MRALTAFFARPLLDTFYGLERCLAARGAKALALALPGLLLGFWVYVPFHELLHAFGCLATGGTVSKLEVGRLYGGDLLALLFPWVEAGGEYAGRLSGFDTGGSDLVYLATDLAPFLLTLWPGVWLLRWAVARERPLLFGATLPWALAPFLSLTGDAYEIGSILVTNLPPWASGASRGLLRSDDLLKLVPELAGGGEAPWLGLALATLVGIAWAFATYALGGAIARRLGMAPVEPAA